MNLTFSSCTRSHGTSAGAAHLDAAPVTSLGKPRTQGADASSTGDLKIEPNDVTNYTQIFSKTVVISGTSSVVPVYGRQGSEMDSQEMFQLKTLKKELQNALLWGYATAASTTATAGEMQGIYERIRSTSVTDISDAAQSHGNMETMVESAMDYGAVPTDIFAGLYACRTFNSWGQAYISHPTDPMEAVNMMYGTQVSRLNIGGVQMNVHPMVDLHAHILQIDASRVGCGPLQGRAFFKKPLDPGGDKEKSMVIGEYTACVPNVYAHQMLSSVKFA